MWHTDEALGSMYSNLLATSLTSLLRAADDVDKITYCYKKAIWKSGGNVSPSHKYSGHNQSRLSGRNYSSYSHKHEDGQSKADSDHEDGRGRLAAVGVLSHESRDRDDWSQRVTRTANMSGDVIG